MISEFMALLTIDEELTKRSFKAKSSNLPNAAAGSFSTDYLLYLCISALTENVINPSVIPICLSDSNDKSSIT